MAKFDPGTDMATTPFPQPYERSFSFKPYQSGREIPGVNLDVQLDGVAESTRQITEYLAGANIGAIPEAVAAAEAFAEASAASASAAQTAAGSAANSASSSGAYMNASEEYAAAAQNAESEAKGARDVTVANGASRVRWFSTRDDVLAAVLSETWPIGAQVSSGLCKWQYDGATTAIPDMVGWAPVGDVLPEHFGVTAGIDQTTQITALLTYTLSTGRMVKWGDGPYLLTSFSHSSPNPRAVWRSRTGGTVIRSSKVSPDLSNFEADFFIKIGADTLASGDATLTTDIVAGASRITLPSAAVAKAVPGKTLLHLHSARVIETDDRGQARSGVVVPITAVVNSTTVEIGRPIPETMRGTPLVTGAAITAVDAANGKFTVASMVGTPVSEARYRIRFNTVGGAPSSATAYPTEFDPATGTFTLISGYPAALSTSDTITISRGISYFLTGAAFVDIQGVRIDREKPTTTATAGEYSFRGLWLYRALNPVLRDMVVANFPEAGVRIDSCYGPVVENVDCHNANRAYNGYDGTGYGVSVFQSSYGTYRNLRGFGCRRTLDFGGTQAISWDNTTEGIEGYGGGTAYNGVAFWPNGSAENSIVGSHGAAYGTIYNNSRGVDVWAVMNLRGKSESVKGVYGAGRIDTLVNVFSGDGLNARGLYYTDERPDWVANPDLTSKATRHGFLNVGIAIDGSIQPNRTHVIADVALHGLKLCMVSLSNAPNIGWLVLGGSQVYTVHNEDADQNTFQLVRVSGTGTPTISGGMDLGHPTILNKPNAPKSIFYLARLDQMNLADGAPVKWPDGSVRFYLSDDAVAAFPAHATGCGILDLHCPVAGRSQMCSDIYLSTTGRTYTTIGAASGMDFLSAVPTGASGTDGNVNVAYQTASAMTRLYVENRRGTRDLFALKFSELAV